MNKKNAFTVGSSITKKNGKKGDKQLYKCIKCGKKFVGGKRLDSSLLWQEYVEGKQTYRQLSVKDGCSIKTIQRRLDSKIVDKPDVLIKPVIGVKSKSWGLA
jgi:DNA-directed RNA polymerase subunit RPC12/RpoP